MKVLLIGMDGAHIGAFNRGWTPFISSLIEKGNKLNIKNDLISRGWLEIATGTHASITGAMYDNPMIDGTLNWKDKFSINDIPNIGTDVKPIWQVLNEKGYSVGIMNLPATFPAPKVNGFFVSGGGGGAPVTEDATPDLCYPKEILDILQKNKYIVDERIVQLYVDKKLTTPNDIFQELANKNKKRTISFIELANKYKIDFGFVVYKTSSVTAETIVVSEWKKFLNNEKNIDHKTIDALKIYYNKFDNEIKKISDTFPQTEIIFCSDHGSIARTHTVNPNIFLQNNGFQATNTSESIFKSIVVRLKKLLPFSIKMALKKVSAIQSAVATNINFDSLNSTAFCRTKNDWAHGIFINDKVRFGGPVEGGDIGKIKNEIIEKFNAHPEVLKHNLRAYSLKENDENILEYFPDIVIDCPSGYLTNNISKALIREFSPSHGITGLSSILRGDIISIKSHEPLAVDCGKSTAEDSKLYDGRDLTAIYDLVLKKFNIKKV